MQEDTLREYKTQSSQLQTFDKNPNSLKILRLSKEKFDIDIFLWTVKITGMFKLRATVICNSWPHWNSELFLVNDGVMSHLSQTGQHNWNLSWLAWYKTAKSIAAPLGLDASPTQITSLVTFH